jgi:hypothetical protein
MKVDRVLANHSLSSTASQGISNIPFPSLLLGCNRQAKIMIDLPVKCGYIQTRVEKKERLYPGLGSQRPDNKTLSTFPSLPRCSGIVRPVASSMRQGLVFLLSHIYLTPRSNLRCEIEESKNGPCSHDPDNTSFLSLKTTGTIRCANRLTASGHERERRVLSQGLGGWSPHGLTVHPPPRPCTDLSHDLSITAHSPWKGEWAVS